jgi:hypothetical protein
MASLLPIYLLGAPPPGKGFTKVKVGANISQDRKMLGGARERMGRMHCLFPSTVRAPPRLADETW